MVIPQQRTSALGDGTRRVFLMSPDHLTEAVSWLEQQGWRVHSVHADPIGWQIDARYQD